MKKKYTPQQHLERFRHMAASARRQSESSPDDREWACVALFYAALHLLDAYLIAKQPGANLDTHSARNRAIAVNSELRRFGNAYRMLQNISEEIRYIPTHSTSPEEWNTAQSSFAKIVAVIEPLLLRIFPQSPVER